MLTAKGRKLKPPGRAPWVCDFSSRMPACGETRDGVPYVGPKVCDQPSCGSALNTIFHERLHRCGAPPEAGFVPYADEVATLCVGK